MLINNINFRRCIYIRKEQDFVENQKSKNFITFLFSSSL